MNERTHFFIKICLSHFILERVMFFVCERWVQRRGQTVILTQSSSRDHSSTSFSSWLGCSTVGHWGPKALCLQLVWIRHLVPNWLQLQLELTQAVCGTWLYNCLTTTCFHYSSAYLHWCISWLTARSRVNILHYFWWLGLLLMTSANKSNCTF